MPLSTTILAPSVITKVISRIFTPGTTLQTFWGFQQGGPNTAQDIPDGLRSYGYDIFDNVRSIAQGRAPGAPPATIAPNPVGHNQVRVARANEKVANLSYEMLSNIRRIGEDATSVDVRGLRYLEHQLKFLAQRFQNFREFITWGMMRGSCGFNISGDDWLPVLSSPDITIDWQIPSGNKSQLNMLGGGDIIGTTWSNAAADIPGDLDEINAAFQQLVGAPLDWVMTDGVVWNHVMNNTAVKAQAGTSNTVFDTFEMTGEKALEGAALTGLRYATLKARPWLKWFIIDAGLEVSGTFTKYFSGGEASFGVAPQLGFALMQEGSELYMENDWDTPQFVRGFHAHLKARAEPARVECHGLDNRIPELTIPKALAFADVVF